MLHVRQQLKKLKQLDGHINPDRLWVVSNKTRLMQQVRNTIIPKESVAMTSRVRELGYVLNLRHALQYLKPVMTALVVAIIATGGWIASVSASFNSLPGDKLWGVKRAAQNTEVAVKSIGASDQERAQLHLNLAKSRAEDIKKVITERLTAPISTSNQANTVAVKADLHTATRDVQDAVKAVSDSVSNQIKAVGKDDPHQAVQIVKGISKDTTDIIKTLSATVSPTSAIGADVSKQVIETVKAVNDSSLKAVEAVVQEKDQVAKAGETAAVKSLVTDKLTQLVQTTEVIKQDVKTSLGLTPPTSGTTTSSVGFVGMNVTSSFAGNITTSSILFTTPILGTTSSRSIGFDTSTTTTSAASTTPAVLLKEAERKTVDLQQSAGEIKKIIDEGDLQTAVDKLRGLNETAGSAQQLLLDTKTQVQNRR